MLHLSMLPVLVLHTVSMLMCLPIIASVPAVVVIDNDTPRTDMHGNLLPVSDGGLQVFQGRYWLYGAVYCGCDPTPPPDAKNATCPKCAWKGTRFAAYVL